MVTDTELPEFYGLFMKTFNENGYLLIRKYITPFDINYILRIFRVKKLDNLLELSRETFLSCARLASYLPELHALGCSSKIQNLLLGCGQSLPVINTRPLISFSHEKLAGKTVNWKVPAHQDWPSMKGSINGLTAWIPLVDVSEELGPLQVIPGSHLLGALECYDYEGVPVLKEEKQGFISLPMEVGDVLVFSPFLIHRSGVNISNDIRLSAHFRFDDADEETFRNRGYPRIRKDIRDESINYNPTAEQLCLLHS